MFSHEVIWFLLVCYLNQCMTITLHLLLISTSGAMIIKLDDFKNCNLKKGNRDRKSKNYANKIELMINNIVVIEQNVDSKAFAIPILTARL